MTDKTNDISIRTLGRTCLKIGEREFRFEWPTPDAKKVLCAILNPVDESIGWDRLGRTLFKVDSPEKYMPRLKEAVALIEELCVLVAGRNIIRKSHQGVGLNHDLVRLDAHEFRECSIRGLHFLATGNHDAARGLFERALHIYKGPFLPGERGKIVDFIREDLNEFQGMIRKGLQKCYAGAFPDESPSFIRAGSIRESLLPRFTSNLLPALNHAW